MTVSINYNYKTNKYDWELYDGPDGTYHYNGTEDSFGVCFEKIVQARLLVSIDVDRGGHETQS